MISNRALLNNPLSKPERM